MNSNRQRFLAMSRRVRYNLIQKLNRANAIEIKTIHFNHYIVRMIEMYTVNHHDIQSVRNSSLITDIKLGYFPEFSRLGEISEYYHWSQDIPR